MSHPADTVVSKLNNDVGSTPIQAARELGMKGGYYLLLKLVSKKLIEKQGIAVLQRKFRNWKLFNVSVVRVLSCLMYSQLSL